MKTLLAISLCLFCFNSVAGITGWIDFNLDNGHVKIPAKVAGIDTYAILDTGAQVNAINKAFIREYKLELKRGRNLRVTGAFGEQKVRSFNKVPVHFLGIDTELSTLMEGQLGHHSTGLMLGAGVLDKFIFQFDYPNNRLRLITHDTIDVAKFQNIELRNQRVSEMPIVKVHFPGERSMWLMLDTGNNGGLLVNRDVARKMNWLEGAELTSQIASGINTQALTDDFNIPSLTIGPYELEHVRVTIPAKGTTTHIESRAKAYNSRIKGPRVEGLIGYDVLKHFVLTIDYKNGYAHIGLPEQS